MFVLKTDFDVVPYSIPNLVADNSFNVYVTREEETMLKSLLGITFYGLFIEGLAALPAAWVSTAPTVIDQEYVYGNSIWKALSVQTGTAPVPGSDWELVEDGNIWLRLKNGSKYVDGNGRTYEWVGMAKMLTPYIFSMWLRDTFDNNSGIGVVIAKGENSKVINPSKRIARAYNEFSHIAGNRYEIKGTLYGFLKAGMFSLNEELALLSGDDGELVIAELGGELALYTEGGATFDSYLFKAPGLMNFMNI